jgi:sensor histidine kinase YesM
MLINERKWIDILKQLILINLAATVIAIIFNVSSFGLGVLSLQEYVSSFVYSNCIGTLILIVIFYLSPRWNNNLTIVRLTKVFVSIFIATFWGVIAARFILSFIFPSLGERNLIPDWRNLVFSLGMGFTFGFAYYFYEISQAKLRQRELAEEKAKTLAREAQLASLESRIHPHFLFNTLNSIAALIREDPILAEKMVEKLSALLRYSLDSNAESLVFLEQELEITEKYLEIEKVRFDKRLQYKIELDEKFSSVKLPPLALQTLVENSIKHVAAKTSGKTEINVSAKENGINLIIEVSDNGMGFDQNSIREGHGLDILQKRLTAIFQNRANLEIIENGTVRLKIPK